MKKAILFGAICFLVACGGDNFTSADKGGFEGTGGEGGEDPSGSGEGGSGGSGSSSGTGGESPSTSSNSTSSSSGTGCIPKNCNTIAVELGGDDACGQVEDGCGNFIDCGGCSNPQYGCGEAPPDANGDPVAGIKNLCGGGCVPSNGGCMYSADQNGWMMACNKQSPNPPNADYCIEQGGGWCCLEYWNW